MTRPTDPSKYILGPLCRRCGGTLYYPKGKACVACTRERNAAKYTPRGTHEKREKREKREKPAKIGTRGNSAFTTIWAGARATPVIPKTKLATALEDYRRSPSARERSKRLDALILKPLDQGGAAPLTAGDIWRSMLPHGYQRAAVSQSESDAQRAAELIPLVEAVEAIYSDLPDLATAKDVADKLDPALVERVKNRWFLAITMRLKKLGAVSRDAGNTADGTRVRLYILRGAERFAGVKGRKLFAAYRAIKAEQQSKLANSNNKVRDAQPPSLPRTSRRQPAKLLRDDQQIST
jgi:hypothetical protein